MSGKGDKGGAEAYARFKQFDYKLVRALSVLSCVPLAATFSRPQSHTPVRSVCCQLTRARERRQGK